VAAIRTAAALEVFQAAALFHDDVFDAADTRRGHPSAHRAFEARHRAAGWQGDPAAFGVSAAVLLGDLALVAAQQELTTALALTSLGAEQRTRVQEAYNQMGLEVMVGQYLDVQAANAPWGDDPTADEARSRQIVTAKAASYSVRYPLVIGALLAGQDPQPIDRVGLPLGIAFQLRDDVLGVFGDEAETGKPVGGDLVEGKRTVLAARTLALGTPQQQRTLRDGLGRPDLGPADIAAIQAAIRDSGAYASHERLINELTVEAEAALAQCQLTDPGAARLRETLARSVRRQA
jgi:geranylgeranyl diphosphate synthase type I